MNGDLRLPGFRGRTAVVTGAAQGIGREIAAQLQHQGARVGILDLQIPEESPGADAAEGFRAVQCDVTDEQAVDEAITDIETHLGPVDILVNNAGVLIQAPVESMTLEQWNTSLAVNLTGAFLCSRRVLPSMRERRYGRLIHMGSSAGKTGGSREMAGYAAAKAGLMAMAKSIASEYAAYGVTSNALAPTLIDTDMIAGLGDLADRIPVGRLGEAADVAFIALVLASEAASYITGEVTDVNGGFLID